MKPGQPGQPGQPVRDVGTQPTQPLAGVRVLDLSGRMGAYCGKILAALGADVLKVELPSGDVLRSVPPFLVGTHAEKSGLLFAYYHHNKKGITLNWECADAEPLLRELASGADVVVASPKGERQRVIGFVDDPPSLSWVPNDALTCFITPFGLTGPYREWRATPFTSFAMSGYMHPVGPIEGPPLAMPGQQFCDEAGVWAAFLIQAVLRSPPDVRSQVIDHSVHEVGLFYKLGQEPYSLNGGIKTRVTNFGPPPSGIWRCSDGFLDVASHSDHHWDIFVDLVGRPEVLVDPMYRDRTMRIQLFDLLTEIIADLLSTRSAKEFVESGQSAGLPCALMQTGDQFVLEEQARGRGFFIQSSPGESGAFDMPGAPFLSAPPMINYHKAAPILGEANEDVYVHQLGHSIEELARWRSDGLV
jgi:crotonobetainyl-CoA:carnitine CoA-transferase CaiB-like acyl-CoA transferase